MPNLDDVLQEFKDVLPLVGPLPAITAGTTTPTASVNPRDVAAEVIGFDLNPDPSNRTAILEALTRAFPLTTDKTTQKRVVQTTPVRTTAGIKRSYPLVGRMNVAAVALQSLADQAEQFDVRSLGSCDNGCGPEPLVGLIRRTIRELVEDFAGGHNPHAIDSGLVTLCGFDIEPNGFPNNPNALGGYLAQLRDRCHLDLSSVCCGLEGQQGVTGFDTLVGMTSIFARAWLDARTDNRRFFAVNVHEVQHHLFGVVSTLAHLRRKVPAEAWVTAEIPSNPPIPAATLWDWMHRYCSKRALEMLRHGCDGKTAVRDRMRKFHDLVSALICGDDPPCGLRAFHGHEVQALVRDLQCHVQNIIAALSTEESHA